MRCADAISWRQHTITGDIVNRRNNQAQQYNTISGIHSPLHLRSRAVAEVNSVNFSRVAGQMLNGSVILHCHLSFFVICRYHDSLVCIDTNTSAHFVTMINRQLDRQAGLARILVAE